MQAGDRAGSAGVIRIGQRHVLHKGEGMSLKRIAVIAVLGAGGALLTDGANLLLAGKSKSTNAIFIKSVQGVTTDKGGIGWTVVRVAVGLDVVHFRVRKAEAEQIRRLIVSLVSG